MHNLITYSSRVLWLVARTGQLDCGMTSLSAAWRPTPSAKRRLQPSRRACWPWTRQQCGPSCWVMARSWWAPWTGKSWKWTRQDPWPFWRRWEAASPGTAARVPVRGWCCCCGWLHIDSGWNAGTEAHSVGCADSFILVLGESVEREVSNKLLRFYS